MKDHSSREMNISSDSNSEEREYLPSIHMEEMEQIHTRPLQGLFTHEETKIFQSKLHSRKRKKFQETTFLELPVKKLNESRPIKMYKSSTIRDKSKGITVSADFQGESAQSGLQNQEYKTINSSQLQSEACRIEEFPQALKAQPESFFILQRLGECLANLEVKNVQTSSLLLLLELHLAHFENKLNKLSVSPNLEMLSSILCNEHCKRCDFIRNNINQDRIIGSPPVQHICKNITLSPRLPAKNCFKAILSDVGDCQAKQCSQKLYQTRQAYLQSQSRENRIAYLLDKIKQQIKDMQFKHSQPSLLYQLIEQHYMLFDYELNAKISAFTPDLVNKHRGTEESEKNQISGSPRMADINFGTAAFLCKSQNKNLTQSELHIQECQTINTSEFPDGKVCTVENTLEPQKKVKAAPSTLQFANQYLDILISYMNYELQKTVEKGEKLVKRKRKPSSTWKINPSGKLRMKISNITSSSESSDDASETENEDIAPPFTPRTLDAAKEFITPLGLENKQFKNDMSMKSQTKNMKLFSSKYQNDQYAKQQAIQPPELAVEHCKNSPSVKIKNEIQETSISDASVMNQSAEPKDSLSKIHGHMQNPFPNSNQILPTIFIPNRFDDAVQNNFQRFPPFIPRKLDAAKQFITPLGLNNSQLENNMSLKSPDKNTEAFPLNFQNGQFGKWQVIQSPELSIEQCQNFSSVKIKKEIQETSTSDVSIIDQSLEPKISLSKMQGYMQKHFRNSSESLPTIFSPNQFNDPVQNTFQYLNSDLDTTYLQHTNKNFGRQRIMASETPHVLPRAALKKNKPHLSACFQPFKNPITSTLAQTTMSELFDENISDVCEPAYSANFEAYHQSPEPPQTNVTFDNNNFVENLRDFPALVQTKQSNFTSPVLLPNNCMRMNMQFEPVVQVFYRGDSPTGIPYNGTATNSSVRNDILFQPGFTDLYRNGSPKSVSHSDAIANVENISQDLTVQESIQQANSDEIYNLAGSAGSGIYTDAASTLYGAACITIEKCKKKNSIISSFISNPNLDAGSQYYELQPFFNSGTSVPGENIPAVSQRSFCQESSCPCTQLQKHKEIKIKTETDNMDPMTKYTISLFENQDFAQFFKSVPKYEYPVQHRRLLRRLWEDAQVLNYFKITSRHISPDMRQQILKNNPHPATIQKPQN